MTLTLAPETETRLLALAARRNQPPEAVVDAALEALWSDEADQDVEQETNESQEERQKRLHALMDELVAEAHAIVPEPYDSPVRTYYRESEVSQIIAEKFRKQGFNVD